MDMSMDGRYAAQRRSKRAAVLERVWRLCRQCARRTKDLADYTEKISPQIPETVARISAISASETNPLRSSKLCRCPIER